METKDFLQQKTYWRKEGREEEKKEEEQLQDLYLSVGALFVIILVLIIMITRRFYLF